MTFEQWMREVDRLVWAKVGVSAYDLPDAPYSDWYTDGYTAKRAAAKVIKMAKE